MSTRMYQSPSGTIYKRMGLHGKARHTARRRLAANHPKAYKAWLRVFRARWVELGQPSNTNPTHQALDKMVKNYRKEYEQLLLEEKEKAGLLYCD